MYTHLDQLVDRLLVRQRLERLGAVLRGGGSGSSRQVEPPQVDKDAISNGISPIYHADCVVHIESYCFDFLHVEAATHAVARGVRGGRDAAQFMPGNNAQGSAPASPLIPPHPDFTSSPTSGCKRRAAEYPGGLPKPAMGGRAGGGGR